MGPIRIVATLRTCQSGYFGSHHLIQHVEADRHRRRHQTFTDMLGEPARQLIQLPSEGFG